MRPLSIKRFEQLYLAAVAVGWVSFMLSFSYISAQIARDPAVAQVGYGPGILIGTMVLTTGVSILLWYFTARRASNLSKWILVILALLGLMSLPGSIATASQIGGLRTALILGSLAAQLLGIAFLFRRDSRDWFANQGRSPVEPSVFE